ncbi:MAG: type II secretion system minor pseudopilin GspK [Herminiimonas sp.]|nr:type II secretion system minor pseudopilin GspK [Herminiimonas sp.]
MPIRQRGVAVITALLLTTLAITIVASLFWQQQVQVRSIENQRMQLQKEWVLRGALDWARLILREDARMSEMDHLGEPWAVSLAETRLDQYVDNGSNADVGDSALSGAIIDAQSRYNLTNLSTDGVINPAEVAVFAKLLSNLNLDPSLAKAAATMMATAQPRVTIPPVAGAAPAAIVAPPQASARQLQFKELDDLFALPGFKDETMRKLKDYVVVLPRDTPINVNTASAEVISARIVTLSLSDAQALVASRERAYFRETGDFKTRDRGEKPLVIDNNKIDTKTKYFLVTGKVRMSRGALEVQALIERLGQTSTRLISVRQK